MAITSKIDMFATHNDTPHWAVCVDGRFGLFPDRKNAERVYALIPDCIDDSPFGSCVIMSPHHDPISRFTGKSQATTKISAHKAIDIEGYIKTTNYRSKFRPYDPNNLWNGIPPIDQRLANKKASSELDFIFFGIALERNRPLNKLP